MKQRRRAQTAEPEVSLTDHEWRTRLTPEQHRVLRGGGTERAFSGAYWNNHERGLYRCAGCGSPLFSSSAKFDSGTGWPSFFEPALDEAVTAHRDVAHLMVRTEVRCRRCDGHLGHVFADGPAPTGDRYCVNSCALQFEADDDPEELS